MLDNVVQFNGDRDTRDMMSDAKFFEGYSRWDEQKGRYETWDESVSRVMDMHRKYYKDKMSQELNELINEAEQLYKEKYFLGAQRALQFGGDQLLKHHMRLYNCSSTYADRVEFFGEYFYTLLCGAGMGVSVQKHHIEKLPKIQNRNKSAKIHQVTDDIEGWAKSADVLMSSYFVGGGKHPEFERHRVYFDTSLIREKGAMISGGFKAPGPEPLRKALDKIEHLLQGLILKGITSLSPIHVYDISMHLADAVLAGGVRRSATIFLFSPDDEEMMKAKTGNWFTENPQRGRSNNSALLVRSKVTREQFSNLFNSVKEFGEPGFIFAENEHFNTNPCFSGDTIVAVADGRNGVSIQQLAEENKPFNVYSGEITRTGNWRAQIQKAIAFKTGTRKTLKLTLSDGSFFRCTPEHKLAIPGGHYIEAKNSLNVELEGFFTHKDKSYRTINSFSNGYVKQHRMIWEFETGEEIEKGFVIDHIVSGSPDFIENLQLMSKEEHNKKTGDETSGQNNAVFKIEDTKRWKNNLSNKTFMENNPRFLGITNEQLIENARLLKKNNLKITFENLKMLDERTPLSFSKNRFEGKIQVLKDIVDGILEYIEPKKPEYIGNSIQKNEYNNPIVISIEDDETIDVYDLKVENNSNFYILTKYDDNFMNSTGILVHNCAEIGMYPQFDGISGIQGCNLTEINGSKSTSKEEFLKACRGASILGTLQAGYTDFKFIGEISKKIFEREALLGVSITGWMNNPQILLNETILHEGAELVKTINKLTAKLIGINPAARTTTVKPAGNASVILKTASGIHGEHSPLYLRNVQMNKDSEVAQLIKELNPYMVEESVWSVNKTDYIVSFPVIPPKTSIWKDQLYGINLLEKVKHIQQNWIEYGTDIDLCVDKTVRHNVSNTIDVLNSQWSEVEDYIFENKNYLTGISLLAGTGDKDYAQAPFTAIESEDEIIRKYGRGAMFASGLIVDGTKVFDTLWSAISIANQEQDIGDKEKADIRADWIRRYKKYADSYFNGDKKRAEYCLKAVYLLHKWSKIQENYIDINFAEQLESKKYTDINTTGAANCLGVNGACLI